MNWHIVLDVQLWKKRNCEVQWMCCWHSAQGQTDVSTGSVSSSCPMHSHNSCSGCLHLALRDIPAVSSSSPFQHTLSFPTKESGGIFYQKIQKLLRSIYSRMQTGPLPLGFIWIVFQPVFRIWMLLQSKYLKFILTLLDKGKLRNNVAGYLVTLWTPKLHYLLEKPTS